MEKKYIIIVSIFILTIAIGISIYFLTKKSDSNNNTNCQNIDGKWIQQGDCIPDLGLQKMKFQTSNPQCDKTEYKKCNIDCKLKNTDQYGNCDPLLHKRRTDSPVEISPKNDGKPCSDFIKTEDCSVKCTGQWGNWSDCDKNTNMQFRVFIPDVIAPDCPISENKSC